MRKLDVLINMALYPIKYKFGTIETIIRLNWNNILHLPLSAQSRASQIQFDKYNKFHTLYIEVNNGNTALEIQYIIPDLIEKIAQLFGYKAIHEIKIKQNML